MSKENSAVTTAPKKTEITDQVLQKVNSLTSIGELKIPDGYSPENALKSAYLILNDMQVSGKPVLDVCSRESIANALFDMVVQALSPMKKQCYFIPYGNKLTLSKSYAGTMAIAKRVAPIKSIAANVIFEGDEFIYEIDPLSGRKKIVVHKQILSNIDQNKIVGAYAVILMDDGESFIEPMTMKEIETSWMQGATKGNSPAHKNFRGEMCKKTAIGRVCKMIINSSDDSDLYKGGFDEEENEKDTAKDQREAKKAASNIEEVTFEEVKEVTQPTETPTENELHYPKLKF